MATTVKQIDVGGFRGIRTSISIPADHSSLLVYGDNGSGKSSITDAFEWFYWDRIGHLSTEEIGRKGIDALRNIFIGDDQDASVALTLSDDAFSSRKTLSVRASRLVSEQSNSSDDFGVYLSNSQKENLLLRYRDLLEFILYTKAERLNKISHIIGFEEVSKIKAVLKKAVNDLKRELRIKDYENRINAKQATIIDQIDRNVASDEQYFEAVASLVAPLKLGVKIVNDASVDKVLESIKKPDDKEALRLQASYEKTAESLRRIGDIIGEVLPRYDTFYDKCKDILSDLDKIKKVSLATLLSEALNVLEKGILEDDTCPVCLQPKQRKELMRELRGRRDELSSSQKAKDEMVSAATALHRSLRVAYDLSSASERELCLSLKENTSTLDEVRETSRLLAGAMELVGDFSLTEGKEPPKPQDLGLPDKNAIKDAVSRLTDRGKAAAVREEEDPRFTITSKLTLVRQAYREIKALRAEARALNDQTISMERVYSEFVKTQRVGLEAFLSAMSADINEFYLYMNVGDDVEELELVPLGDEDEFVGVTLRLKFHGEWVSPPDKYLSESHVNCIGLSLFLASVKTFNKTNGFFVLDDVISSFDKGHRVRFAHLLKERFSDYQVIVLTHEQDWFRYLTNVVKGAGWSIRKLKWDGEQGAVLEEDLAGQKQKIERMLNASQTDGLGNEIRKYLEHFLKDLAVGLGVKMAFLYNDRNEDRMPNELLSDLKSTLKKRKCDVKDHPVIARLMGSTFIGHKTSHDSSFSVGLPDLKAFYEDVVELESVFVCGCCGKPVAERYYDSVDKLIRCSCGNLKYSWLD